MLVDEVNVFGGDVLKFAGDAFFAQWRVITEEEIDVSSNGKASSHPWGNLRASFLALGNNVHARSLEYCVLAASKCAASIVEKYSNFQPQLSRELSISFGKDEQVKVDTMLNVHCGLGCGSLVGLHVGDSTHSEEYFPESRREFLFLGDPINQVSAAEGRAAKGEVYASPEAVRVLKMTCDLPSQYHEVYEPIRIAERGDSFFTPTEKTKLFLSNYISPEFPDDYHETLVKVCSNMDPPMVARLHRQLSLYVHQVVRDDNVELASSRHALSVDRSRHASQNMRITEAELRNVYTMFINANIDPTIVGDFSADSVLFNKLQKVMQVTCRELQKFSGQLRQFIVDDKGVVLIGTFGLRGSTFRNMITNHALPATFAIHHALKNELHIENKIGATFGKVYCGVVGGVHRHEFAVMGAPVNLAARLMHAKTNNGILVDEVTQAHADSRFAFKRLHPVEAKGYEKPVVIFEPLHAVNSKKRIVSQGFVGRQRDVTQLMSVAKSIMEDPDFSSTIMSFIIGEPGIGKTALAMKVYDEIKLFANLNHRKVLLCRSTSSETEQRIPLSSFRKIFLGAIRELFMLDGTIASLSYNEESRRGMPQRRVGLAERRGSLRPSAVGSTRRMSMGRMPARGMPPARKPQTTDCSLSLASLKSTKSVNIPFLKKLCEICDDLNYPNEFADIVGSQLLQLEGAIPTTHIDGRIPSIDDIVEFLANAFMYLTESCDLAMIFLDDFQWIDSFTWKVIRVLCDKGKKIFIIGAMRSQETQTLRRMSSVGMWHTQMQSRKGIVEISIGPLEIGEVKQLMSRVLGYETAVIDEQLINDVFYKTGGITIYVIELLENIKRNQAVAVDKESGTLKWTQEAEKEQIRINSNSVAEINFSFLNRLDSLDRGVGRVLQTCAVLGMSFSLSDVICFHPEMDELVLELSLNAAVDELILVEDVEEEDEDESSLWSGRGSNFDNKNQTASWNTLDDRYFQFSHAMWRKSVLDAMLTEHKVQIHRAIAEALEKEEFLSVESSDIGRLLTLFDHWKSCGNFGKAAPLALEVGLRLEEWDLVAQSLGLYEDAFGMIYDSADNPEGESRMRDENEVWLPASASPATVEFILRLHIRIARCHSQLGNHGKCATFFEDAYKMMNTSPIAAKLNTELVLPILSGLCSIVIKGIPLASNDLGEYRSHIEKFLQEATERNEEMHIACALAMKASLFAGLGKFDEAIVSQEALGQMYVIERFSQNIQREHGKDFVALSFSKSVQWYVIVGLRKKAESQIDFVIENLLPHYDLRDVDTIMELIFPILMVLKSLGRASDADAILFTHAINPYHDLGGSSTTWIQMFNPIAYLFRIHQMIEEEDMDEEILYQITHWVMQPEHGSFDPDLQFKGNAIIGEICSLLAGLQIHGDFDLQALLDKGRMLLMRVVYAMQDDNTEAFLVRQAKMSLDTINSMEDDSEGEEIADPLMIESTPSKLDSIAHGNSEDSIDDSSKRKYGHLGKEGIDLKKCVCTIL
jgi:class 3 adenylate cyclase